MLRLVKVIATCGLRRATSTLSSCIVSLYSHSHTLPAVALESLFISAKNSTESLRWIHQFQYLSTRSSSTSSSLSSSSDTSSFTIFSSARKDFMACAYSVVSGLSKCAPLDTNLITGVKGSPDKHKLVQLLFGTMRANTCL